MNLTYAEEMPSYDGVTSNVDLFNKKMRTDHTVDKQGPRKCGKVAFHLCGEFARTKPKSLTLEAKYTAMDGYAHNANGVSQFYNCLKGVELSPVGVSGARGFVVPELGRRSECSGGEAGHVIELRGNPLITLYLATDPSFYAKLRPQNDY